MNTITISSQSASDDASERPYIKSGSRLALLGKAGAGKTTASTILNEQCGHHILHFAAALKDVAVQLWGDAAHHNREALQGLGVFCRGIDPNTWTNIIARQIDEADPEVPLVIDDCRFPNELELLLERDFIPVRIVADESLRVDRLQRINKLDNIEQLEHESETALDDIEVPYTLYNNTNDRFALHKQVMSMYKTVCSRD